jgi:hypothetical protein
MDKGISFLLAEDPQRPEVGQFILHTRPPVSLIRVLSMDDDEPINDARYISKDYSYAGNDSYVEVFQLVVMPFSDGAVEFNKEDEADLLRLLDRAWRWYSQYIKWEDNQG